MFYIDYRGFRVYFNGSATFNVFSNGHEIDVFTRYNCDRLEAAKAIFEWLDYHIDFCGLAEFYGI